MKSIYNILLAGVVLAGGFLFTAGDMPWAGSRMPAAVVIHRDGEERGAEADWFMVQRAFPSNDIPRGTATKMVSAMQAFAATSARQPSSTAAADWIPAGPSNIGGRITALLIHPVNDSIIYAAAASGGLWKTTDRGTTWRNIFNESFSTGALSFAPDDPNTIYLGTGEANPSSVDTYPGNGVWRSTDAGQTWVNLGLQQVGQIGKIAVNPLNPKTIFVSALGLYRSRTTDRGIYRSTDRGATWSQVLYVNDTTGTADVAIDPQDTAIVLATSWTYYRTLAYVNRGGPSSALYRSTDGGTTWIKNISGMPHDDASIGRISLAFAPSDPATVYALVAGGGGYNWNGVYRSFDTGDTWFQTYNGSSVSESQVWYNNIIVVHPTNPNIVWAGMTGLYKSTDGGSTFSYASIAGDYHVDHHAMEYAATDTNLIVLGNDGGIYISDDGGSFWNKSYDLPVTQYYAGTVSALNPNHLLGGTQDNGSSMTRSGTDPWNIFYGGDGFYCLIDPTDSNYIYAEYQYGGLGYSTNGGGSFFGGTNGLNFSEFAGWETPVAMDLRHPKTLYTGLERVYRTTNNMQSWTAISPVLTYHISAAYSTVSTIDVSSVDSSIIYAGTGDSRLWVTTNGGGTWTDISAGLPLRWVSRVVADPESTNVAYVTLSGFRQYDSAAHVFRTRDFGQTWTNIGSSLPDIPVNDLIVDPATPANLYVATDLGVVYSSNRGTSWSTLGTTLPGVTVHDLAFHAGTKRLYAFTHGRSVWSIDVSNIGLQNTTLTLAPRWNLISVPLAVQNDSVPVLFPQSAGQAFAYVSGSGYIPTLVTPPGQGYWLQVPGSIQQSATIYGAAISVETLAVSAGWNLIGSLSAPINVSGVMAVGTTVQSNIFTYNNGYVVVDTIQPGKGHWVKVSQGGQLILQNGAGAQRSAKSVAAGLEGFDTLRVRDAAGTRQTLFFGGKMTQAEEIFFEMPPAPAEGMFDVRFGNGSLVAPAEGGERVVSITIRGGVFPLELSMSHGRSETSAYITVDGKAAVPEGDGRYRIAHQASSIELHLSGAQAEPSSYALSPNYPNPFNPSTAVRCSVPVESNVRLEVYDMLGRDVKTLFDGRMVAGSKTFIWDATDGGGSRVASGIYFVRMESRPLAAEGTVVTFVRKMVYMR